MSDARRFLLLETGHLNETALEKERYPPFPDSKERKFVHPVPEPVAVPEPVPRAAYHALTVEGFAIQFPYVPMQQQNLIMHAVGKALNSKSNAAVESPTGTGKSLGLLAVAFAFIAKELDQYWTDMANGPPIVGRRDPSRPRERKAARRQTQAIPLQVVQSAAEPIPRRLGPLVVVVCRTQTQITQMIGESRKLQFRPRMCVLASRKSLCIHPERDNWASVNDRCKELLKGRLCTSYHGAGTFYPVEGLDLMECLASGFGPLFPDLFEIADIEDLYLEGKRQCRCPYYESRYMIKDANVLYCTSQYIIDPIIREAVGINLRDAVLIFDEAHNVQQQVMDAASFVLEQTQLWKALETMRVLAMEIGEQGEEIRKFLTALATWFIGQKRVVLSTKVETSKTKTDYCNTWEGDKFGPCLGTAVCSLEQLERARQQLDWILDVDARRLELMELGEDSEGMGELDNATVNLVSRALRMWTVLSDSTHASYFQVGLFGKRATLGERMDIQDTMLELRFTCVSAALVMGELDKTCRSIIFASGTLGRQDEMADNMDIEIPHQVNARKNLKEGQLLARYVSHGRDGTEYRCTYQNWESAAFRQSLGETLLRLIEVAPQGTLVFFPSFGIMDRLLNDWEETGVLASLEAMRNVFREERGDSSQAASLMEEYESSCLGPMGAVLLAVYRGGFSEGVDFHDHLARFVIGIPYQPLKSYTIEARMRYLQRFQNSRAVSEPSSWYSEQAFTALNQAIGRCIRHQDDWGSIVLLDSRIAHRSMLDRLPKWIRYSLGQSGRMPVVREDLVTFYTPRGPEVEEAYELYLDYHPQPSFFEDDDDHDLLA